MSCARVSMLSATNLSSFWFEANVVGCLQLSVPEEMPKVWFPNVPLVVTASTWWRILSCPVSWKSTFPSPQPTSALNSPWAEHPGGRMKRTPARKSDEPAAINRFIKDLLFFCFLLFLRERTAVHPACGNSGQGCFHPHLLRRFFKSIF